MLQSWLLALPVLLAANAATWLATVRRRNVNAIDTAWGALFILAAAVYASTTGTATQRATLVLALVTIWGLRLAIYLTARNWRAPEDHRYAAMRRRDPRFATRSLYSVFGLQAMLAWIVSLPLLAAIAGERPLAPLDVLGSSLWIAGFAAETVADWQLARFKADARNRGRVLDRGLWRYSRHPNYFGECCVWWGFYCFALAAGGWWALPAPVLMTVLLLRISGVALLEKTIVERRPAYAEYVRRTSAFVPWPRRKVHVVRAATDLEP
jgi:steroid 5-alpha reductase family enzyme